MSRNVLKQPNINDVRLKTEAVIKSYPVVKRETEEFKKIVGFYYEICLKQRIQPDEKIVIPDNAMSRKIERECAADF